MIYVSVNPWEVIITMNYGRISRRSRDSPLFSHGWMQRMESVDRRKAISRLDVLFCWTDRYTVACLTVITCCAFSVWRMEILRFPGRVVQVISRWMIDTSLPVWRNCTSLRSWYCYGSRNDWPVLGFWSRREPLPSTTRIQTGILPGWSTKPVVLDTVLHSVPWPKPSRVWDEWEVPEQWTSFVSDDPSSHRR